MKLLACFMVVAIHAIDELADTRAGEGLTLMVIKVIVKPCVPLFVMITGWLVFNSRNNGVSLSSFYSRRIGRLLWPLVFWSVLAPILFYFILGLRFGSSITDLFSLEKINEFHLGLHLWNWILNCNGYTFQYWYLYMLVGLYFVMPIVNVWISKATKRDMQYLLGIWIFTLLLPYIEWISPRLNPEITDGHLLFGRSVWNMFGTFYYVSGFMGYYVTACYLSRFPPDWRSMRVRILTVGGYVASYFFTLAPTLARGVDIGHSTFIYFGNYCSINIAMMSVTLFVMVMNLKVRNHSYLGSVASLTMGIYLVHYQLLVFFTPYFEPLRLPSWLLVVLLSILVFAVSGGVTWLFRQSRFMSRFVS